MKLLSQTAFAVLVISAIALSAGTVNASHVVDDENNGAPLTGLLLPTMNPIDGKRLFVEKGCIACHAINNIGGEDAPAMDAHRYMLVNPFNFAAKMWNHAAGMIFAQEEAFGEQLTFTGQELADIIAFVHNEEVQLTFSEEDLPPEIEAMIDHGHGDESATDTHQKELGHQEKIGHQEEETDHHSD